MVFAWSNGDIIIIICSTLLDIFTNWLCLIIIQNTIRKSNIPFILMYDVSFENFFFFFNWSFKLYTTKKE